MISLERRDGRPLRIGHRGAAALAPENTLGSFRAAVATGVDLIEFDVIRLAGGELVVAHSDDLHEVSHGVVRGSMRGKSLEEVRELCPELPTFDDALAFFAGEATGIGVHVDLKHAAAAREVVASVRRFELEERTFVSGFSWRGLREVRLVEPRIRTGVSFPRDPVRIHGRRGSRPWVRAALRGLRTVTPRIADLLLARSQTTALVLQHSVVSAGAVRRAHARGAAVVAWTVDDPEDLARVDEAGVDAVVSNDPRIFVSTLDT